MTPLVVVAIAGIAILAYFLIEASNMGSGSSSSVAYQIALAIGVAEGGYDASGNNRNNGTLPSLNHNPGDLTVDVNNSGNGSNGGFVTYPDDATGYAALEYQISEWLNGSSANAGPASTIDEISQFYTTTDQTAWAANVASVLGVPSSTPISQIGAAIPGSATVANESGATQSGDTTDTSGASDQSDGEGSD